MNASPALQSRAAITAIGSHVPEGTITNDELERLVDTNHEWIVRRTGIVTRHRAADDEFSSHLAIAAVRDLMQRYSVQADDVDGIIVATTTPDMPFPSVASQVQRAFGMARALAVDINAACAGFVTGLQMANGLILTGAYRKILVIGAETLTKITDYTDRTTCVLFGDGAGAVLVEQVGEGAFLSAYAATEGTGGNQVYITGLSKLWEGQVLPKEGKLVQNGREVYKWAVSSIPDAVSELTASAGCGVQDLDWFVPHSANLRMIEAICERLELPSEKALQSVVDNGNTSAASIPLALDAGVRDGKLKPGHLVALFGFGSGLTQSGLVLRWTAQQR
ncbi:beta-ketoacyl-ACP synthase III [Cohnella sp. CFH 77786]|uniref:ketoacyl-ACP synthase III n=1 Tax=Cohnella sp. CFH 77786 TaxID=2662265 RepID=UPI001C60814E|nr:ketoacyl-ACP synthase III [Cohnella sp. CFH 77786]MBW5447404.1 beta-ketoacyl-ACP synthase III [Cohnella sp. CFH 77786]